MGDTDGGYMDEGESMYVVRNGIREEIQPTSYAIDGKKVYDFDPDSGILKLNRGMLSEGTLEKMSKLIGESPDGISITIPIPLNSPAQLQRVREVRYLSENEIDMERIEVPTPIAEKPKGNFFTRFLNDFLSES